MYANKKILIGDIKGANKIWDELINNLSNRPKIIAQDPRIRFNLNNGFAYISSEKEIYDARNAKIGGNFYKGDIKIAYNEILAIKSTGKMQGNDWAILGELSLQIGAYDATQEAIEELTKFYAARNNKSLEMGYCTQITPIYYAAKLALAKGDYTNALNFASELKSKDKSINNMWVARANLINAEAEVGLGNFEKANEYCELAIKSPIYGKESPDIALVRGYIALAEKDYATALNWFNTNLSFKPGYLKPGNVYAQQVTYTKKAEAYLGLKDFVNAKKSYEMALVYFPDHEPAINGLAKLEANQVSLLKSDKVVAAGKDVMIKGMASDPSGLKTVTINGANVYSKDTGDFWGSVVLKEGKNSFEIVATDLAGNKSTQTIEIEKAGEAAPVVPIAAVEKQGKNYAVFIASQNYDDSNIPSLENPVSDAIKLKLILKSNYNFADENLYTLFNPQRDDFKKKFLELREVLQPEDNLVIFYAGHGIWVEKEKKGYWLLTDAQRNDINTWIPNKQVLDLIAELPARHTLLITDACFSGSVFKSRGIGADAPAAMKEMDNKITRVAITSGNDTEVPDESVFMKYLVKALSENREKYLTAQKMFINQIIESVMTESKTEPRYGTLELAGHVGGDYIFSKK
jgi:tetratricopeptide (TPR) repeat protein